MGSTYDLVSIHSKKEQAFITSILAMHDTPDTLYEFWIGFHDFVHWDYGDFGSFVWSDQTAVDFINWADNEPNGAFEYEGICVEMWGHDDFDIGHWNDLNCERLLPYICKSRASRDNQEPPVTKKCDNQYSDFDSFKGSCYKWVDEPATWSEAETKCSQLDGSHLVSILTESEEAFVMVSGKANDFWIGLSDERVLN